VGPTYLLDTNILVHFVRNDATWQLLQAYSLFAHQPTSRICVVTIGEMMSFAQRRNWGGPRRAQMQYAFAHLVHSDIADDAVYQAYADIDAYSESIGKPMAKNDLWIAAVAKADGCRLLTTDTDFDHLAGTYLDLEFVPQIP
jgi:tRNA(fMet)-specific endonuclease VapC